LNIGFIEKFLTGDFRGSGAGFDRTVVWMLAFGVMLCTRGLHREEEGTIIDLLEKFRQSFFFGSCLDELSKVGKFEVDLLRVVKDLSIIY
jgi:hypothetical protein